QGNRTQYPVSPMAYADERDAVAAKMRGKPLWYRRIMRQHYEAKWNREEQELARKEEGPASPSSDLSPIDTSTKT
ncbi:MAG: hypothetical protein ACRDGM_06890, partial [bacterium]